jgi:hypothetical protein
VLTCVLTCTRSSCLLCCPQTIVAAVREGRRVWDNLRKILLFNLPVNFAQGGSICECPVTQHSTAQHSTAQRNYSAAWSNCQRPVLCAACRLCCVRCDTQTQPCRAAVELCTLLLSCPTVLSHAVWAFVVGMDEQPLTAMQVLYVNLVTACTLGIMLAAEPPEPSVMDRPPRRPGKRLLVSVFSGRCSHVRTGRHLVLPVDRSGEL